VLAKPGEPGLIFVFWPVDRMVRVSLRTFVQEVGAEHNTTMVFPLPIDLASPLLGNADRRAEES
jgi:hypothetical protein